MYSVKAPVLIFSAFLVFPAPVFSQINGYAKVTSISGNVLTLSDAVQTFDSLNPGDRVIVIQMQGASVSSTANSSGFGTLNSLGSAGLYESVHIAAINAAATSATLAGALLNTYDVAGSVQILTFPQLGTTNYTTNTNLVPVAWNGSVGGVLAFSVNGNLILKDNISADGMGFRGGVKSGSDGSNCNDTIWRTAAGSAIAGSKGEGIYRVAPGEGAGKAKAVNGGGAGTIHNGGGGGGGNATAGGEGYYGFPGSGCSATVSGAGQGGTAVSSNIHRVFMGGGGGGGQENNGTGSNGGNGGGIIFVKADTIIAGSPCFPLSISSNGSHAANAGNDGAGGGGAGGSIVLDVEAIRIDSSCPLTVSGNGGNGGDVGNATSHGSGGGGGQGAIYVSASGTFSNTVFSTMAGQGGDANSSGSPRAADGTGPANSGVVLGAGNTSLPIYFYSVEAKMLDDRDVVVSWESRSYSSLEYYEIAHTTDGIAWNLVGQMNCRGDDSLVSRYTLTHRDVPDGANYYQVTQVHNPKEKTLSKVIYLQVVRTPKNFPSPNPSTDHVELECDAAEADNVRVFAVAGRDVTANVYKTFNGRLRLDVSDLTEGLYTLVVGDKRHRFLVKR